MTTYRSGTIPHPASSAQLRVRLDLSAAIHAGNTGWDLTAALYLEAVAAGGFPNRNNADSNAHGYWHGANRANWGPSGYAFGSSGSPITNGQLFLLATGSEFIAVTQTGDLTLNDVAANFTGGGGTPLGSESFASQQLILPHIDVSSMERYDGANWVNQVVERYDGANWVKQIIERYDGANWVRQV